MVLSSEAILSTVRAQLATDLNCSSDDFDRDGFVFCTVRENPGRRPFPRSERHFEMLTMGGTVIVSASPDILPYIREQLDGKTRDEAFNMPFVSGSGHYYLPDFPPPSLPMPGNVAVELIEGSDIHRLYSHDGFRNAIGYDVAHPRPDVLVTAARIDGVIVGMAGASADCEMLWQVGIDVLPEYRGLGIAAPLVSRLANHILERGKIPYYGTASSNIASQRVAHRAGFSAAWVCAYQGRFDGAFTSPTG